MLEFGFHSVMDRVTSGIRFQIGSSHFECRFGYGFELCGSGFGCRVSLTSSTIIHHPKRYKSREMLINYENIETLQHKLGYLFNGITCMICLETILCYKTYKKINYKAGHLSINVKAQ